MSVPARQEEHHSDVASAPSRARNQRYVIQPRASWSYQSLREIISYRELLGMMLSKGIRVRYKQTFLGIIWVVLQPLMSTAVFSLFLGRFGGLSAEGVPYPFFTFTGIVLWQMFSQGVNTAAGSLFAEQHLLSKIYFPRLVLPAASVVLALIDSLPPLVCVFLFSWKYDHSFTWHVIGLPLFYGMTFCLTMGLGIWLAALHVKYRDLRFILPFFLQLLMFASPVLYTESVIPQHWQAIFGLNPMVTLLQGFRWSLNLGQPPDLQEMAFCTAVIAAIFVTGFVYFRKQETKFADFV